MGWLYQIWPWLVGEAQAAWRGITAIDVAAQLTILSIIGAVASFWIQHFRTIRVERTELYQRLETNSLTVFAFEAQHADVLEKYRDEELDEEKFASTDLALDKNFSGLQAHYGSMKAFVEEEYALIEDGTRTIEPSLKAEFQRFEKEWRITRKYYEQTLNLFEMATRFRRGHIIEDVVFGSWVIWFYDTLSEWSFRVHWRGGLRENYTEDLREMFNLFVEDFDPQDNGDDRKSRYFAYVGAYIKCRVIKTWLARVSEQQRDLPERRRALARILDKEKIPRVASRPRPKAAVMAARYRR